MRLSISGGKNFVRSINLYKKQSNWRQIMREGMEEIAEDNRDDAEFNVYQNYDRVKGTVGDSIKAIVYRRGNYAYLGLKSDHPAINFIEYGGYMKKMPAYNNKKSSSNLGPYAKNYGFEDTGKLAGAIKANQPFEFGTFAMTNALTDPYNREQLESAVRRAALRAIS